MGVGELIESAMALDAPDPDRFLVLADALARVSDEGLSRVAARESLMAAAADAVRGSDPHWRGPRGDAFRQAFGTRVSAEARLVEPGGADGYRALGGLGTTARRVAEQIRAARADHRNRIQAAFGVIDEWGQRAWTNVQDLVGAESDEDAQATREAMDRLNLAREQSEARLQAALAQWTAALEATAVALQRSKDRLGAALGGSTPELARHPEASYRQAAVTEDLQHRWISSVLEPRVYAVAGDPVALRALWDRLSQAERDVLVQRRPDLVRNRLWGVLTNDERSEISARDSYVTRRRGMELLTALTVPLRVVDARVGQLLTLAVTYNSDRTVDVLVSVDREAGVEVGIDDIVTGSSGMKGSVGVVVRFESEAAYEQAISRLRVALEADARRPERFFSTTRDVLIADFGASEKGIQVAGAAIGGLEAEFPEGVLPLRAGLARDTGGYYDGSANEAGLFLRNQLYARVGPVDATLEADGRLYTKDGDRVYARLTLTAATAMSGPLLERSGFHVPQLENMGLGEGTRGTATITITAEATNANRDPLARLLTAVASGRVDPADLRRLHAGSEVTVAVSSGNAQREAVPTNPIVEAEANVTDATTIWSFRKAPNGGYYLQAAP